MGLATLLSKTKPRAPPARSAIETQVFVSALLIRFSPKHCVLPGVVINAIVDLSFELSAPKAEESGFRRFLCPFSSSFFIFQLT